MRVEWKIVCKICPWHHRCDTRDLKCGQNYRAQPQHAYQTNFIPWIRYCIKRTDDYRLHLEHSGRCTDETKHNMKTTRSMKQSLLVSNYLDHRKKRTHIKSRPIHFCRKKTTQEPYFHWDDDGNIMVCNEPSIKCKVHWNQGHKTHFHSKLLADGIHLGITLNVKK